MTISEKIIELRNYLSQMEDGAALAVFRIGFGLIMCYDMTRYAFFYPLESLYFRGEFQFKYLGFEWVKMLPGNGLYWHLTILAVLALMIATGLFYRMATILFAVGFTWFFLIDRALYLNHFYMVVLFSILMCVVPAGRLWSLDVYWRGLQPKKYSPRWARWLLLAQLEIILIYAGLVKINPDWLNLAPLERWLAGVDGLYFMSTLFEERWAIVVAAYGVIGLHLIGAPLLLFKSTRVAVLCVYASFHTLNHFVFTIGIFPWFTLFASLLCLEPDWPRRLAQWRPGSQLVYRPALDNSPQSLQSVSTPLMVFIGLWLIVQITLPLRHWIYQGDVAWNDNGHLFSWRMKLRTRHGNLVFMVRNPDTGQKWKVRPGDRLMRFKLRKLNCHPDMILQFAHHLADEWITVKGVTAPAVYAANSCSLNYRASVPQIDRHVDLTTITRSESMESWVLPLEVQLPNRIIGWSRVAKSPGVGG
jgi:vitamin K-dependent gamma-carboxylase